MEIKRGDIKLTARQAELLRELRDYKEEIGGYARPMDLGATDASYHSRVLAQLRKKGLVEVFNPNHTNKRYIINDKGLSLVK